MNINYKIHFDLLVIKMPNVIAFGPKPSVMHIDYVNLCAYSAVPYMTPEE